MVGSLGTIWAEIGLNTAKLDMGMAAAGAKLKSFGTQTAAIGKGLTMGLTLPIVGVGVAAIKMGLDFSKGIEYANTMLKLSGKELEDFKAGVLDLSNKYGHAGKDIATTAYQVSSVLHTSGEDTIEILDAISMGAKAGKITTEKAGNAVIRMMSIYGIKAKDTMKVVDTLSASVKAGNADWEDMASVLPNIAGLAKPMGITIQELGGAFAAVSAKAGSSAEAGTMLRGVIKGLVKPSDEMLEALDGMGYKSAQAAIKGIGLKKVLEKLGKEYGGNAAEIAKLFPDIRGLTGAFSLFDNEGRDLAESMGIVADGVGETKKQIEAGMGPAEKFKDTMQRLKNTLIKIFEIMLPVFTKLTAFLDKLAVAFSKLSPKALKTILIIAGIAAAIGPVLMIVGKLIAIVGVLTSGPLLIFLAVAGAIGLLVQGLVERFGGWNKVLETLKKKFGPIIKNIIAKLPYYFELIKEKIGLAKDKVMEFWDAIQPGIEYVKLLGAAFLEAMKAIDWTDLLETLKELWVTFGPVLKAIAIIVGVLLVGAFGILSGAISMIVGVFKGLVKIVSGVFDIFSGLIEFLMGVFTGDMEKVKDGIARIGEGIVKIFSGMWDLIKGLTKDFIDGVVNFFKNLYNTLVGHSIIPDMVNAIIAWFVKLYERAKEKVQILIQSVKDKFTSMKNSVISVFGYIGDKIGGWVSRWYNNVLAPLKRIKDKAAAIFGSIRDKVKAALDLTARHSPSILDLAKSSIGEVLKEYSKLSEIGDIVLRPNVVKTSAMSSSAATKQSSVSPAGKDIYITGNTFNVRDESDVKKIAKELYSLSHKGQRAAGVLS